MSLSEDIGGRVRATREHYEMTREALAEKAHLSPQFIVHIENGTKSMTTNSLFNITRALNVTSDYLLFGLDSTDKDRTFAVEALASMLPEDKRLAEKVIQNILQLIKDPESKEIREVK